MKTNNFFIKIFIMRYLLILCFVCFLVSCKTKKPNWPDGQSNCPENTGVYDLFNVYENETLVIKKDDIGKLYYQKEESEGKMVFAISQEQNKNPNYADGHYTEEIIFELDNSVFDESFENFTPKKILFGVFCYCKDKAGYYPTENTLISFDKETKTMTVTIEQIVENQILDTLRLVKR